MLNAVLTRHFLLIQSRFSFHYVSSYNIATRSFLKINQFPYWNDSNRLLSVVSDVSQDETWVEEGEARNRHSIESSCSIHFGCLFNPLKSISTRFFLMCSSSFFLFKSFPSRAFFILLTRSFSSPLESHWSIYFIFHCTAWLYTVAFCCHGDFLFHSSIKLISCEDAARACQNLAFYCFLRTARRETE